MDANLKKNRPIIQSIGGLINPVQGSKKTEDILNKLITDKIVSNDEMEKWLDLSEVELRAALDKIYENEKARRVKLVDPTIQEMENFISAQHIQINRKNIGTLSKLARYLNSNNESGQHIQNLPEKGNLDKYSILKILGDNLIPDDYDALKGQEPETVLDFAGEYLKEYQGRDKDEINLGDYDDEPSYIEVTPQGRKHFEEINEEQRKLLPLLSPSKIRFEEFKPINTPAQSPIKTPETPTILPSDINSLN